MKAIYRAVIKLNREMDDLIERLLACTSEEEQRAILEAHRDDFSPSDLVVTLKARADPHLRDEPAQARHLAEIATTVADWCGQPEAQALAAWTRANARYYQGHFLECLALYEKALAFFEQTEDTLTVARLHSNCSAVLTHLGRYAEALKHLESARAILEPQGPSPYLAGLEMNLAMAYQQLDRYSEAVAACERGRAVALAVGDRARAARLDVNRAVALQGLDRFREAIDLLQATLPVLEAEGEQLEVARAYLNLGWLRFHTGHYRPALIDLEIARQRFAELDNEMEVATADLHRAQVYLHLNLLPEAIEMCQSTQTTLLSDREVLRYAALADYYAGIAYGRLGERDAALQHLAAARERMAALGLPVQAARIDLERAEVLLGQVGLADPDACTGTGVGAARPTPEQLAEAQMLAQAAHDLFEARGLTLKTAWAQIALADTLREMGNSLRQGFDRLNPAAQDDASAGQVLEAARDAYTQALTTLGDVGPAERRYRAWYGLGWLAEADGQPEEALAHYRRAIEVVTTTATALGESELRAGFLHDKLDAFQAAVSLSLDTGRTEEAFELVELARAGRWMSPPDETTTTLDADTEAQRLLAEVARLREVWHWRHSRLKQEDPRTESSGEGGPAREMHAWKELHIVERRLADAVRTLRLHPSGRAGDLAQPESLAPANVAADLAEGQCLLSYYVARDQIVAFVITRTSYAVVKLPATWPAVVQRLDRLRFSLRCQGSDTLNHLQRLWEMSLAPLAPHLADCRQLIVVPHNRLHYLPFHALHDGAGYLLERCQVTYMPTASLLAWRSPAPNTQSPISNAQSPPLALILACSDQGRLPGTRSEGRAIHAVLTRRVERDGIPSTSPSTSSGGASGRGSPYKPLLHLDAEATSVRLRQHAPDCTLLHIAAHGRFRHDNPLFSALHLGDGPLLLADLGDLRLPGAPLVVLSACETGLGDLRGGDVLGLSHAFLRAGAKALLVSLWRVPDEATARLMAALYQHLSRGAPPAEALRQAQQALLSQAKYAHPRQWAGWVLVEGGKWEMGDGGLS